MTRQLPPGADIRLDSLPDEPKARHEELVDLFGRYVMWLRTWSSSSVRQLVESSEARGQLGTILRHPYEEAARLSSEDRERAIKLADTAVDGFIELLLRLLAHRGFDFHLGPNHSVRYKLVMEIVDNESGDVVQEEIINRSGKKHFADYWGRWLNR